MFLEEILHILKQRSEKICYSINNQKYTYKEFYKYVCNIYNFLLLNNPKKEPVVIYGHKDIYMKASFLACSYAGITYIPIDKSMPKNRVNQIIKQIKPMLIIGDFYENGIKSVSNQEIVEIMDNSNIKDITNIYLNEEDIYYIIFTSGSTGIPKGVKVTYKNLNSCMKWLKEISKIDKGVILNQANFSFDLSVADLYLSLVTESEHYVLPQEVQADFKELFSNLQKSKATMMVATPSFADLLLIDNSFNQKLIPNLKTILFCGEKLSTITVQKIYERFDNVVVINSYGPTECTFAVTSIEIPRSLKNNEILPIGKPKKDVDIIIVDENLNELENGQIGEILILGESVSNGYVNMKNDGFLIYKNKRAYLTGDLGYFSDGNFYCIGRKDSQIKYKGYRIELDDIEKNLYSLNYIEKAVVVASRTEDNKVNKILAFVKLKEDKTSLEIRKDLQSKIPSYMCPVVKIVNEFPLNDNGKCDVKELLRKERD